MDFPENLTCPICSMPMEAGFIVSITGIHWSPDEKTGRMVVPNMKTDVMYPENEGAIMQNPRYLARRCKECEIAVLHYKE